jgi:hypothetical protein
VLAASLKENFPVPDDLIRAAVKVPAGGDASPTRAPQVKRQACLTLLNGTEIPVTAERRNKIPRSYIDQFGSQDAEQTHPLGKQVK